MSPLRPAVFLVVLGPFSFLATITILVIGARLMKFDIASEEPAPQSRSNPATRFAYVTLPFLQPALIASLLVGVVSVENFKATLILVGFDSPRTIVMYDRIAKASAIPVLNAVSFFLIFVSGSLPR